jgi:maleate isomerase
VTPDRLTVGVVTPHSSMGPEVELPTMTSGRVSTVLFRTGPGPDTEDKRSGTAPASSVELLRASTQPAALDAAAGAFRGRRLAAVAHASTTSGYVLGQREETDLLERLAQRFGVPGVASCAAVAAALRTNAVSRVQLVHPPWFDRDFDELGAAYFGNQGFDAVVTRADGLPDDPARILPRHVVEWVAHHVEDRAEAVFLAGNGFRAAEAVEDLERRTGLLVLEANQAMVWRVLAETGTRWTINGYGRLLRAHTTTT